MHRQEFFNNFGEALLYAIENNGLNQASFSRKWGKDPGMINKYVKNERMPRPETVNSIEQELSVAFKKLQKGWIVVTDSDAQKAINSINRVEDLITAYKARSPNRGEIPQLLEFRDMIEKDIDKLVKKKGD